MCIHICDPYVCMYILFISGINEVLSLNTPLPCLPDPKYIIELRRQEFRIVYSHYYISIINGTYSPK